MATKNYIPDEFWDRLSHLVPESRLDAVRTSFHDPIAAGVRVNTLVTDVDAEIEQWKREGLHPLPLPWFAAGNTVSPEERALLLASDSVANGRAWVQNPSSMVPPVALGARPGESILDLAAAPGSKTLQLACMMEGAGELAAVEVVRNRFFRLQRNLKAQKVTFVRTFLKDGTRVWHFRPDHFDRVLLDAPCSTEGRFRIDEPKTFAYWSESKIRAMASKQKRLLESALRCVRPGGVVVYSTCSFAPEENEAVVAHALRKFDVDVEPVPVEIPGAMAGLDSWRDVAFDPRIRNAVRVVPDGVYEAFFVCRLRRMS